MHYNTVSILEGTDTTPRLPPLFDFSLLPSLVELCYLSFVEPLIPSLSGSLSHSRIGSTASWLFQVSRSNSCRGSKTICHVSRIVGRQFGTPKTRCPILDPCAVRFKLEVAGVVFSVGDYAGARGHHGPFRAQFRAQGLPLCWASGT